MATRFGFRLIGAVSPQGQIDVEDAVAILSKLQELATRVGRLTTEAADLGRPPEKVERVARLRVVGLTAGSTIIEVERAAENAALDFDLAEEKSFDERFERIIEAIGADERPGDVTDSIADTAAGLLSAFQRAAPEVEFSAGGKTVRRFNTHEAHRETWKASQAEVPSDVVTLVGRLEKVDLKSHDFRIRDDMGNAFSLPKVAEAFTASHLIGSYVSASGLPEHDARGTLSSLRDAEIIGLLNPLGTADVPDRVSLDDILADAPGLEFGGIPGMTDEEAAEFFVAMGM